MIYPAKLNKEAWGDYLLYRKEQKMRKLKDMSVQRIVNWLANYEPETQMDIVETTIRNTWIGLFPPKDKKISTTYPQTNEGWLKRGQEIGLSPRGGESWPSFIGRVKEKMEYSTTPF